MEEYIYYKGDLVVISRYGNKVFKVEEVKEVPYYTKADGESLEIAYTLAPVVGHIKISARYNEITLVCRKKYANEYLKYVDKTGKAPSDITEYIKMDDILDEMGKILTYKSKFGELTVGLEEKLAYLEDLAREVQSLSSIN
ncbi:hypothetical protein [Sporosarcina sp. FSL W7-1283]|uniref:hypothetical protein n=1 Tax=Sporosarcina sp. FSL W7-1283 TaxID=2921560 RepID=UPI0030F77AFA